MMPNKAAKREEYSALRAFMHGYLHEDFADEYGSAKEAVREFRSDAEDYEFKEVAAEWQRFFHAAKTKPIKTVQAAIREHFGGGWMPRSHEEIEAVSAVFEHPRAKDHEEEI
jgi:hypothetical protein